MICREKLKAAIIALFVAALCLGIAQGLSSCSSITVATPSSSPSPMPSVSPTMPPVASGTSIDTIVSLSPCTYYNWKDRGTAPLGYFYGLAHSFQKSLCSKRSVMTQALGDSDHDALALYGLDASLVNVYTLVTGLGVRESGGNYGEGPDVSAGPETAETAESGAWQYSHNSINASQALRDLYTEYQKTGDSCLLGLYSEGARGSYQSVVGNGTGAAFQQFTKLCPGFAAEYTATLIRVLRKHFGPLNRMEAQVIPSCQKMFADVEAAATCQ